MKQKIDEHRTVTKQVLTEVLHDYPKKQDLTDALKNYPTKQDLADALKNYPTKQDLSDALKNYPTKQDLSDAFKNYPTKGDLIETEQRIDKKFTERLNASLGAFRIENQYEFKLFRDEIHQTISVFTNRILTAIDPLLQELETRQQDREIGTAKILELEKRVTKLEHA